jgi:tetratricopeptide (TPR) repeat protein
VDDPSTSSDEDLWAQLPQAVGRDRIAVLHELGERAARREDYGRAITLWEEIESYGRDVGDPLVVAEALRLQGGAAFWNAELEDAVSLYERSSRAFSEAGAGRETARVLCLLADTHKVRNDHERQLSAAVEARSLAEFEELDELAGDAAFMQAQALYFLDREEESLDACRDARDYFRHSNRPDRVAVVDDFTIAVHLFLGDRDEALSLARGCLVLAQMSSSQVDDAYARLRLAEVLQARHDSEEALEQAELAMADYRTRDDLIGVARCFQIKADALFDVDQPEAALRAYADARVLFEATGRDLDVLRCDARSAMIKHWLGDYAHAAELNRRCALGYQVMEMPDAMRWAIVRLMDNLQQDGQTQECLEVAEGSLEAWSGDIGGDIASQREFSGLYALALESGGRVQEATRVAERVISQTPAREASLGTAYCYEVRGRSRLIIDERAAGQDFSHAIALYLARGRVDRARELSAYFLPVDGESAANARHAAKQVAAGLGHR